MERWILAALRHHEFFSLDELNQAIASLLSGLNARPFQRRTESRLSLFNTLDLPALRALPMTAYEYAVWRHAKVAPDYHVQFDGCYFSVPHSLIGQRVDLRITGGIVEVLSRGNRVACHQRDTA
ncbi:MAG: IS21 family transposase, partial [Thiogranum sp.]